MQPFQTGITAASCKHKQAWLLEIHWKNTENQLVARWETPGKSCVIPVRGLTRAGHGVLEAEVPVIPVLSLLLTQTMESSTITDFTPSPYTCTQEDLWVAFSNSTRTCKTTLRIGVIITERIGNYDTKPIIYTAKLVIILNYALWCHYCWKRAQDIHVKEQRFAWT